MKMISLSKVTFLLLFLAHNSLFAQSVRDASHDNTDSDARAIVSFKTGNAGGGSFELITEGTNSSAESGAPNIYLPALSTGNNEAYSLYKKTTNGDLLLNIPIGSAFDTTADGIDNDDVEQDLVFTLDVEISGDHDNLHFGVINNDGKYLTKVIETNISSEGAKTVEVPFSFICGKSTDFNCDNFINTSAGTTSKAHTTIVIFLDDDGTANEFETSSITNGAYYELYIGHDTDLTSVSLDTIGKGDSQLTISYTGFNLLDVENVYAFLDTTCSDDTTRVTLGSLGAGKSDLISLETTNNSGTAKIKNLTNDTCYGIRVGLCDKFGFCSVFSNRGSETPEEIEVLLKKQGCFFFTAGFAGSHWIIDYFQSFRDDVLRKNYLGKKFVKFYYMIGPLYAPYVLDKPLLQKAIRGFAYVLYGIIHYFNSILIALVAIMTAYLVKRYYEGVRGHGRS
jgi:hypothetical protein